MSMLAEGSDFSAALGAHSIPTTSTYLTLPSLRISPYGQPYIPLPSRRSRRSFATDGGGEGRDALDEDETGSEFCLTSFLPSLPSTDSSPQGQPETPAITSSDAPLDGINGAQLDAEAYHRIINLPSVRALLATFLTGRPNPVPLDKAREIIAEGLDQTKERRGWCMPVIRHTRSVLASPSPPLLGIVPVSRFGFGPCGLAAGARLRAEHASKGDRETYWAFSCFVDPAVEGRGAVTSALTYILTHFYLPHIHAFPGQLVSGYLGSNAASAALHRKLGFEVVGRCYWLLEAQRAHGLDNLALAEERAREAARRAGLDGVGTEELVRQRRGEEEERWKSAVCVWRGWGEEGMEGVRVGKRESLWRDMDDF